MSGEHRPPRTLRQGWRGRGFNGSRSFARDGKQDSDSPCFDPAHQFSEQRQTVREVLHKAGADLAWASATPALDAELLLARALNRQRSDLHAHPEAVLSESQEAQYTRLIARRATGEPLAYIVGVKEFWSLTFRVTPDVLIPRPETELLVDLALARIPKQGIFEIADLGTGSGAIALGIASERPDCNITATDVSRKALSVAADNARRLRLTNIRFAASDWFRALGGCFHLIVSNPPYVDAKDFRMRVQELGFEPRSALISPSNGLADLSLIAQGASAFLDPGGWVMVEHAFDQGGAVRELFSHFDLSEVKTFRDLAGCERVTLGQRQRSCHTP